MRRRIPIMAAPQILVAALVAALFVATGCRPDPGEPIYSELDDFDAPFGIVESLPGPDPYDPTRPRLSFGIFYEGEFSVQIPVDGQTVHYYIYQMPATGLTTYFQLYDDDRVEGTGSDRIIHAGFAWWGGGIHFDAPRDLSDWTHLVFSCKSTDTESFADFDISVEDEDGPAGVSASDYGWVADGEWHQLRIPLSDLATAGADLSALTAALVLGGGAGQEGDSLRIDDLYYIID